jgi:hypothetical protein
MAKFGWAYVDCSTTGGGSAAGPTGSVQFLTGAGNTSGSAYFMYYTASTHQGTPTGHPSNTLVLSGNMVITGTLSASVINYQDIAVIDATGSTFFGNSVDDRHVRTGSFEVAGRYLGPGGPSWVPIISASAYTEQVFVRGFGANYTQVTSSHHTASTRDYILGVAATVTPPANVMITIPSASTFGAGALLVIKDQVNIPRGLSNITLTCSAGAAYKFDGDTTYVLTGTMPAISLYSNGSNWFVF